MADKSDRDTSARSGGYSGAGGQDSPSESRGGPGAGAGSSSSSKGSTSSSSKGTGGGLNSAGNRASGAGPGASGNRTTSGGGGLNSAGNRASGAGPGASGNRSTTGGGFSGNANGGGMGGGLNSAGNRASGAGPGASGNTSTTGGGFGSGSGFGQNSPRGMSNSSLGGGMAPSGPTSRDMQAASDRRAAENASMKTYDAARSLSQENARRADLAQQARTTETKSMHDMADWGKQVKSVVAAGPGWTEVELNNGLKERRTGDRASRNNNPGNIEAGDFAKKAGAVGTDGRFAVFSSKEDGIKAIGSLLGTSRYTSKTVEGAISSYAPPSENNTAAYANTVAGKIGVSKDTPMSSLTASQRDAMARAIMGVEGNTGYTKTTTGTDRFASNYLGGKTAATASTTSTAERNAATTQEAAKAQQQNDPSGLPPGTYRGYDPSGLPPEKPAAAAPRQRSITEKVAAGAIDVGLGMLPGVGMGVSLVNGGLALTGNETLGERIAGSIATGEGAGEGSNSGADRQGSSGRDQVVKNTSTVPKESESFESRYLAFVDPTPRPTPAQRWDYNTPGYA